MSCTRSEEHTSELQSPCNLVCRLRLSRVSVSTLSPYPTLFRSQGLEPRHSGQGSAGVSRHYDHRRERRGDHDVLARHVSAPRLDVQLRRVARRQVVQRNAPCPVQDRKSTRLNSSHLVISYAVFACRASVSRPSLPTRRSSDLKVWSLAIPGKDLPGFRGITTIDASVEEITTFLLDTSQHPDWMYNCDESRVVKSYNETHHVLYKIGRAHV